MSDAAVQKVEADAQAEIDAGAYAPSQAVQDEIAALSEDEYGDFIGWVFDQLNIGSADDLPDDLFD